MAPKNILRTNSEVFCLKFNVSIVSKKKTHFESPFV